MTTPLKAYWIHVRNADFEFNRLGNGTPAQGCWNLSENEIQRLFLSVDGADGAGANVSVCSASVG